jgi:quinohemoprotein amine dehydrogenase
MTISDSRRQWVWKAIGSAAVLSLAAAALAQSPAPAAPPAEGIPVTNKLAVSKCGGCHQPDAKGNLTRISWVRTTPEGWELAIKRMIRLNGVNVTPAEAREIVQYLATSHGLAPEEAAPALYEAERRLRDEKAPNDGVRDACMACHTLGRVMAWRRSKEEWDLLVKMHIGYFPQTETVTFRKLPPLLTAPPPAPGTDTRDPVDRAIEYIAKTFPLETPEWAAWRAEMRAPQLAGRWIVTGSQLGRGRIFGEMVVEAGATGSEFTTKSKLYYVKDGKTMTRSGRAIIYTGYAWRGRSESRDAGVPPSAREVMLVSRDQSQIGGRWFWGNYDEFGIDVSLRRAGSDPVVFGLDRTALKTGSTGERVTILGDSLPSGLVASDIDCGSGVSVKRIVSQSADRITVEVDVAGGAVLGKRDVAVRRSVATAAFAVYDKVDYIKVTPDWAMARLGGAASHPKGFQQFEAIGYNRGADNKPNTADDVSLGPVDALWSVEEFYSTYSDDDKDFVGTLSDTGLFTPAIEGPNPKRRFGRNNHGDVWVVATYKPKDEPGSKPLTAKSYMIVTVPLYVRWDQPEVAQ